MRAEMHMEQGLARAGKVGDDPVAHVVHIVYAFRIGGLENGLVNLINGLPADRYRHSIVSMTDIDPAFCRRIQRDDVNYIELRKPPGHGLKIFPQVFALLRRWAPQIVHTRNLGALEMTLPAWASGVPIRVHGEHGRDVDDPDGSNRRYQWARRAYKPFVTHTIALSRELNGYLADTIGVAPKRLSLICNGVDAQRFRPAQQRAPLEGSPFNDPSLVVYGNVGRLQAVKDQVGLVRAFAHMRRSCGEAGQRARLMIVGDGPARADIQAAIRGEQIGEQVWLAGARADVPQVMQAMDVFVLSSHTEGISNTILEAMACALPVVATRVGGNAELVQHEHSGIVVPAANVAALAEAMGKYVGNASLRHLHGQAGRRRIEDEFSLDGMVGRYDALYQSLLAARGLAQPRPVKG